ncbi:hypothetical protein QTI24_11620 [Variovorax sp. J22P240]|uniref:hypothetical protein n=1 Tax=unclassified Variovorax TaxID=663243 RepID=UPI0025764E79|nr:MULTISPECIES: hypothetical protein [unclassified Variovorax]MDL9999255.1 hypothetical protein [Variovorax sp. J22P240]MDM0052822.1 hypothetical protein [Variovorax sp. J22R115]
MTRTERTRAFLAPAAAWIMLGALALPAHAATHNTHDSKVLGGIERGADATGRGIERAGSATRRGVDTTAERASAPVRRWGESLGRKLSPHAGARPSAPAVGPQGNAP